MAGWGSRECRPHQRWPLAVALMGLIPACSASGQDATFRATPSQSSSASSGATAPSTTSTRAPAAGGRHVVILAVELQFEDPSPGGQGVWVANRGGAETDISCWAVLSSASGARTTVLAGTKLAPHRALHFSTPPGLLRSPDVVTLADREGRAVDRTPELADAQSDDQLWYQGEDGQWRFGRTQFPQQTSDGRVADRTPDGC